MSNGEKIAGFTEDQISAAARVLADLSAEACNVDKDDNWKIYGGDFIKDARAALSASGVASTIVALKEQLAAARNDALEEAAEIAQAMPRTWDANAPDPQHRIAAAIRALASQPAAPVAAALPEMPDTKLLVDIATTVMDHFGLMVELDEDGTEKFCIALQRTFEKELARTPALPVAAEVPVQQPGDVRDTNGTIDGGDVSFNQVFVTMDERPSAELWTIGNRCYLATTRPSAALTRPQIDALITSHGTGGWQTVEDMRKFANSVLAASSGAVAVPEGFVLLPVEPTDDMIDAYIDNCTGPYVDGCNGSSASFYREGYAAMISAAPAIPGADGGGK